MTRVMTLGALVGPVLFTMSWLVLGAVSPGYTMWDIVVRSYSPIAQPISGLGLGVTGPFMNAAFVASAALLFAGHRRYLPRHRPDRPQGSDDMHRPALSRAGRDGHRRHLHARVVL